MCLLKLTVFTIFRSGTDLILLSLFILFSAAEVAISQTKCFTASQKSRPIFLKNAFPPLLYAKYNNIFFIFYLLEFRTVSVKMQRRLEASKGVGEEVSEKNQYVP